MKESQQLANANNFIRRLRHLLVHEPDAVLKALVDSFNADGTPTGQHLTSADGMQFSGLTAHTQKMVIPRVLVAERIIKVVDGRYVLTEKGLKLRQDCNGIAS